MTAMRIFTTGVICVGKTTIGSIVASRLGIRFFDLDKEIERFFGCSIERLPNKCQIWFWRSSAPRRSPMALPTVVERTCGSGGERD